MRRLLEIESRDIKNTITEFTKITEQYQASVLDHIVPSIVSSVYLSCMLVNMKPIVRVY
uniref:Uncharacterized protein n=1 Tax=Arundo donax TaxID=35708 RepID=A0A0A9DCR9_ARUDO